MASPFSKPRAVLLTSSFPASSAADVCGYVRECAEELARTHLVTVIAPPRPKGAGPPVIGNFRLRHFWYPWLPGRRKLQCTDDKSLELRQSWLARLEVVPFLVSFLLWAWWHGRRAELVVSHWLVPAGLVGCCAIRRNARHVIIAHSGDVDLLQRAGGGRCLARWVCARAWRVVAVSARLAGQLRELAGGSAPVVVSPMGVSPAPQVVADTPAVTAEKRAFSVAAVARFIPMKGLEVLIWAAAGMPQVRLLLIGDGPQRCCYEKLAGELGVDCEFCGAVGPEERRRRLMSADLVVVPSLRGESGRQEGTPVVCLEAMALGLPVVASNNGGLAEVIRHGETGWLVPPGDVQALRQALLNLLSNREERTRLGRNAAQAGRQFEWGVIGPRIWG